MKTHAIRLHEPGGPEALRWESVEVGEPGPEEALIRHTAIGLNFIDTYHRSGLYPVDPLPAVLGMEAAGVVEAVGSEVSGVKVGDRVAYAGPMGSYAERRLFPAERLVDLPAAVDDETAAAVMLKGLTAWYLLRRTYPLQGGETVLVHAAAGGVGLLLCQWASALGATVIGTAGSEEKAELAASHGCHHPIVYTREGFGARVREITGGQGVPVIYDGVGRATFDESLECLAPHGTMVSFGNASGAVPPFEILRLAGKGLYLTRPSLTAYVARREELLAGTRELFEIIRGGDVRVEIGQRYPLRQAAQSHRDLEARKTTGSTLLMP
jgi:NADPH2:quinone reductase